MTTMNVAEAAWAPARRRSTLTALAVVLLMAGAFWWTCGWMADRWFETDSYYSHGWLIPLASLAVLYMRRRELAKARVRTCAWGMALLLPSVLVHLAATAWQVGSLSGFAMLGALAGCVLTFLGPEVLPLLERHGFEVEVQKGRCPPPYDRAILVIAKKR